jgi:mRNA-degrading endonuclease RelE of RelBE toxin-antitoxin system
MGYHVLVSKTFQKDFYRLSVETQKQMRSALLELQNDPYTCRSHCDINILKDTKPRKYRLRVGDYRVIYCIEKNDVKVIYLMKREVGYNRLE